VWRACCASRWQRLFCPASGGAIPDEPANGAGGTKRALPIDETAADAGHLPADATPTQQQQHIVGNGTRAEADGRAAKRRAAADEPRHRSALGLDYWHTDSRGTERARFVERHPAADNGDVGPGELTWQMTRRAFPDDVRRAAPPAVARRRIRHEPS